MTSTSTSAVGALRALSAAMDRLWNDPFAYVDGSNREARINDIVAAQQQALATLDQGDGHASDCADHVPDVGKMITTIPAPGASWTEALKFIAEQPDPQVHTVTSLFYKMRDRARAALASLNLGHGAVGAGWKLVPREPTEEMCQAASHLRVPENVWTAMYVAAPNAASAQPEAAEMPGREALEEALCENLSIEMTDDIGPQIVGHDRAVSAVLALLSPSAKES